MHDNQWLLQSVRKTAENAPTESHGRHINAAAHHQISIIIRPNHHKKRAAVAASALSPEKHEEGIAEEECGVDEAQKGVGVIARCGQTDKRAC